MSQSKFHKISVRRKVGHENEVSTGANTVVLLDNEVMKGVRFLKFEVSAKKVAKVVIEIFAEVDADLNAELAESVKPTDYRTTKDSPIALYTLSSLYPSAIVVEKTCCHCSDPRCAGPTKK